MKISEILQPELNYQTTIIWSRFCRLYPKLRGFNQPNVAFNNRLKTTAGNCYTEQNRVEIATRMFLAFPQHFVDVILPHEIAHQIDFNFNGDVLEKAGHGETWGAIMQKYGLQPDRYHDLFSMLQNEETA